MGNTQQCRKKKGILSGWPISSPSHQINSRGATRRGGRKRAKSKRRERIIKKELERRMRKNESKRKRKKSGSAWDSGNR